MNLSSMERSDCVRSARDSYRVMTYHERRSASLCEAVQENRKGNNRKSRRHLHWSPSVLHACVPRLLCRLPPMTTRRSQTVLATARPREIRHLTRSVSRNRKRVRSPIKMRMRAPKSKSVSNTVRVLPQTESPVPLDKAEPLHPFQRCKAGIGPTSFTLSQAVALA